jgi:hypothetical protein
MQNLQRRVKTKKKKKRHQDMPLYAKPSKTGKNKKKRQKTSGHAVVGKTFKDG